MARMSTSAQHPMSGVDAFTPAEIARLVQTRGVAKANAPTVTTFVLGVLAGAFIALGAMLSQVVATGSGLGYGPTRWLAGMAFSLGLILVVIAGAELFTGNNLIVMATASGQVRTARLLRNWAIVYAGNAVGAVSVAVMLWMADWGQAADGAVGETAFTTAVVKASLPFGTVFVRGVLANALVCLAVWLATAGHTLIDKVVAIVFPVAAFVAAGFEHSIANMYFLPMGWLLQREAGGGPIDAEGVATNLAASTLGNVVGGAVLVGLVYWFVYLRGADT
jgi:formate/nitrite transporter